MAAARRRRGAPAGSVRPQDPRDEPRGAQSARRASGRRSASLAAGRRHRRRRGRRATYEAVRLFVERARQVQPDFALTDDNAEAVAEISARLDGLPLAHRARCREAQRSSRPRSCVTGCEAGSSCSAAGSRDLPARQQTLRGTIEWSYELLDDGGASGLRPAVACSPARDRSGRSRGRRLEAAPGVDVVDRLASLRRQEPGPPASDAARLAAVVDAGDDPRVRAANGWTTMPELGRARDRRTPSTSPTSRGSSGTPRGPEREPTLDELSPSSGTC